MATQRRRPVNTLTSPTGQGPEQTLETLYAEHAGRCFGLAAYLLGDDRRAAEVVSEAFLDLWHGLATTEVDLGSWLTLQTHRRAVDRLRRDAPGCEPDVRTLRTAEEDALTGKLGTHALLLLANLSVDERQCLVLSYWGGFTTQEISVITGAPIDTVRESCRASLGGLRARALADPDPRHIQA